MANENIFKRYEKKYMLNKEQFELLLKRLADYMQTDSYGKHTICNIYFDTDDFELIRTSIEKPVYKEKLRLRSYGVPTDDSIVFLEIKKKYKGVVYKRRIRLKHKDAVDFIKYGRTPTLIDDNFQSEQIFKEITYFINFYKPSPKMFIAYDRIAMFGKEQKDLRITFDTNIRSRENKLNMSYGDNGKKLLEDDTFLMEIKASGAIPIWLSDILCDEKIFPSSFSKYGRIYSEEISPDDILRKASINFITNKEIKPCLQAY